MQKDLKIILMLVLVGLLTITASHGQTMHPAAPDLTKQPTLYVVPYAHLDTQWRWDYPKVIREYLPRTMRDNFRLFEKYPHYIFNFSGANRYRMMKEYYPEDFAKLKHYVAAGRWFPAGSSMEENDVNNPSAESIIRQILYGKEFFRREFGKTSAEYMLPDCFGFPASLPSILAHSGIKGFSTQKLSWHSATPVGGPGSPEDTPVGIPFNVGIWEGLDGRSVIAALNATDYSADITEDISKSPSPAPPNAPIEYTDWPKRVMVDGQATGLFADYRYYGTGDIGGAPSEFSVKLMEAIVTKGKAVLPSLPSESEKSEADQTPLTFGPPVQVGDGPLHILQTSAEQMFLDLHPDQTARLPRYKGDLELTEHSAGSLTSQAYLKRWNRKNEVLADAAERASVVAAWLGGRSYPLNRLNNAWTLVMGGQFHDILPGTSIPKAYEYSWNDELLAMNQFADVLTSASSAVASALDTQTKGKAIVVYNPLNISREDVVEAAVTFPGGQPTAVRVSGPDGKEVPSQISGGKVLFLAKVPSLGYAVYDIQPAGSSFSSSTLRVTESSLENTRYRILLDQNGDISSLFDKELNRELLSGPIRLALKTDTPVDWPAWNMDWADQQKPPREYVSGPVKVRIVENGPVRVALEVARESAGSKFIETIRLAAGDAGNRVEINNKIDWKTAASNLKAVFPLSASNDLATYNWDIGTIQRPNDHEKMFEYASHQWFDLTDRSGSFGVTVLSDCKNGSDKPADNTLALTLLRTPGIGTGNGKEYSDQSTQDWGHHEFVYGLASHAGDYRQGQTDWQAYRLNQPLIAFETSKHSGELGRSFSFLRVSSDRVRVLALKKAEASDEWVIRLVEISGKPSPSIRIALAAPITSLREVSGAEEPVPISKAALSNGELVADFDGYQPRTFALQIANPGAKAASPKSYPMKLNYDLSVASADGEKSGSGFDQAGHALPAEMLPTDIFYNDTHFHLAAADAGKPNAMIAHGQTIELPKEKFTRVYVLAASADGDQKGIFLVGDKAVELTVQNWSGFIGQWDDRIWKTIPAPALTGDDLDRLEKRKARIEAVLKRVQALGNTGTAIQLEDVLKGLSSPTIEVYDGLTPGFIKPAPVAWFASHYHNADGSNEPYAYSYLFAYALDVPITEAGIHSVTLPMNNKIRILAMTAVTETGPVHPVQPLYDTLRRNNR